MLFGFIFCIFTLFFLNIILADDTVSDSDLDASRRFKLIWGSGITGVSFGFTKII